MREYEILEGTKSSARMMDAVKFQSDVESKVGISCRQARRRWILEVPVGGNIAWGRIAVAGPQFHGIGFMVSGTTNTGKGDSPPKIEDRREPLSDRSHRVRQTHDFEASSE